MGRVVGAGQLKVIRFYVNTTGFSFLCNIQIIENRFWGEEGRGGGGAAARPGTEFLSSPQLRGAAEQD